MTASSQSRFQREELARSLEATGEFRILRRISIPSIDLADVPKGAGRALIIDCETTGLDVKADHLIELGAVLVAYDRSSGRIHGALDQAGGFNDPGVPIPAEITALTGIDDAMVRGQALDLPRYEGLIAQADIVIPHHAGFDRPMISKHLRSLAEKPWACSYSGIDWSAEGFKASKLDYLLVQFGAFHDGHRAMDDCLALVHVLRQTLKSGQTALFAALDSARKETWRIWATNSPFSMKDALKARGYEWCNGAEGRPKCWYLDLTLDAAIKEISWLLSQRRPFSSICATRLDAWTRFTEAQWKVDAPVSSFAEFAGLLSRPLAPSFPVAAPLSPPNGQLAPSIASVAPGLSPAPATEDPEPAPAAIALSLG